MHPFFDFFNKDRPFIDSDDSTWPASWKTIRFKAYPRYPKIVLPRPRFEEEVKLETVFAARKSTRVFRRKPLDILEVSNLLFYSCGLKERGDIIHGSRRIQPSGGALFPLELYPLVFVGSRALPTGAYHYNVLEHCLEMLPVEDIEPLKGAFRYPWAKDAAMAIVFSFIEGRSKPKYGNLAYKVGLIEAGHIGQNIYLNCAAMGLSCCAIGGLDEGKVHAALDLDGISEVAFYTIAVGK